MGPPLPPPTPLRRSLCARLSPTSHPKLFPPGCTQSSPGHPAPPAAVTCEPTNPANGNVANCKSATAARKAPQALLPAPPLQGHQPAAGTSRLACKVQAPQAGEGCKVGEGRAGEVVVVDRQAGELGGQAHQRLQPQAGQAQLL